MASSIILTCLFLSACWALSEGYHTQSKIYPLPTEDEVEERARELDAIPTACAECKAGDSVRTWFGHEHYKHISIPEGNEIWWEDIGKRCRERNGRAVRKEIRQMSEAEWMRYSQAVLNMANNVLGTNLTEYQTFVEFHTFSAAPGAHFGAASLVWHREYLARFEEALQDNDPFSRYGYQGPIAIPYWDNTLDWRTPEPLDSVLWSSDLYGDIIGPVVTGSFPNFPLIARCGSQLIRIGRDRSFLFDDDFAQNVVLNNQFHRELLCFINCEYENQQSLVNFFVGGQMNAITCSPSDPISWSHAAYIDLLWEEFRQTKQVSNITYEYPSSAEYLIGGSQHEASATMYPFQPLINRDGLSEHYTRDLYTYTKRPSAITCQKDEDCLGRLLWCRVETQKCVSKMKEGGSCAYPNEIPGSDSRCHCSNRFDAPSCELDNAMDKFICVCTRKYTYHHY